MTLAVLRSSGADCDPAAVGLDDSSCVGKAQAVAAAPLVERREACQGHGSQAVNPVGLGNRNPNGGRDVRNGERVDVDRQPIAADELPTKGVQYRRQGSPEADRICLDRCGLRDEQIHADIMVLERGKAFYRLRQQRAEINGAAVEGRGRDSRFDRSLTCASRPDSRPHAFSASSSRRRCWSLSGPARSFNSIRM